jgi:methionyl-tRNA synthetase
MVDRYNADLANGLGNLASRVLAMLGSYFGGEVPDPGPDRAAVAGSLPAVAGDVAERYENAIDEVAMTAAVAAVWELVGEANRYLVEREPWAVARDEARREELAGILYAAAEALRILAVLICPAMPDAAGRLWSQLGLPGSVGEHRLPGSAAWGGLEPGIRTQKGEALFPRLEG